MTIFSLVPYRLSAEHFEHFYALSFQYGLGALRCFYSRNNRNGKLDFIPVDRMANNIIVVAWQAAIDRYTIDLRNSVSAYVLT